MIPIKDNIPTDRLPYVTIGLILANLVVYVVATAHGGSLISGPMPTRWPSMGRRPTR